ncbi:flagellar basal-body MS-ring/collar protein FliF [Litoreibacter roseus]|uniref:Flagellar M-ring protein n=1 Tax=Litoreibacter roseus TaxID=2601869 RepID=A0A6N6JEL5_9RHOB|nr:flagellar basal-body MS-ring/collar protein FliF [Litoreibacter roseus]GFE64397.1 flagellar M-ring protein [Litoreibacter roseus]
MQKVAHVWNGLDLSRQIIAGLSAIIVILGVFSLIKMAAQPNMRLLYSGLSPSAAGEVVAALDSQAVAYDVRGDAIFVDGSMRDQLRLTLASEGLPANSVEGYELLDNLSGFGTTSQMFDAAYLRAKEGELARTILANPQITAARVHIAQADQSPFRRSSGSTASVSVRGTGRDISTSTANGIRFLIASAVSGLDPENVSVINADRGVVITDGDTETPSTLAAGRAEQLKQNVERLISARVGAGRAVVEVNVDTLTEDETLRERIINPDDRVAISSDTTESSSRSNNQEGGDVTVASNLPDGAGGGSDQSSSEQNDTREIVNYEVSETTRETRRIAGGIKRVTVAVLVDGNAVEQEDGAQVFEPRSAEELKVLEDLVKSVVGFDAERGDEVTIRSMQLEDPPVLVTEEGPGWVSSQPLDVMSIARLGTTALVVLALGIFVLRPILSSAKQLQAPAEPNLIGGSGGALPTPALTGEVTNASGTGSQAPADLPGLPDLPELGSPSSFEDDPVERLKALIDEKQDETVEVLKNWIETPQEPAE